MTMMVILQFFPLWMLVVLSSFRIVDGLTDGNGNNRLPFGLPSSATSSSSTDNKADDTVPKGILKLFHKETKDPSEADDTSSCYYYYDTDICIVGGGLAGLALAVGLSTHLPELRVVVIERHPSSPHHTNNSSSSSNDNGTDIMKKVGATLSVAANGIKALNELTADSSTDHFVQTEIYPNARDMMPVERVPVHILPWWIPRNALLKRLRLQSAKQQPVQSTHLWEGLSVNYMKEYDDRVEVGFANRATANTKTDTYRIRAKLVVAADGVHSTMRSLLNLPRAVYTGMRVWRGHVQVQDLCISSDNDESIMKDKQLLESLLHGGYQPFVQRQGLSYVAVFNHHETIPGLLLWQISSPHSDDSKVAEFLLTPGDNDENDHNRKRNLAILRALVEHTADVMYTELSTINMDHISNDDNDEASSLPLRQGWGGTKRVTLIGDAAHACRPTDGQGANMAFEDACMLVRKLVEMKLSQNQPADATAPSDWLDDGLTQSDLVLEFENSRRPRVKVIHHDQAVRALKQGKDWTRWPQEFMDWVYQGV